MATSYGLNTLMEAIHQSEHAEHIADAHVALFESAADDDIKSALIGDDSVESDLDGNGMTKKEADALNKFIEKIPTTKEEDIGDVEEITEEEVAETMALLESLQEELDEEE